MIPDEFIRAQNRFKDKIVQFAQPSRSDYINRLKQGSIVLARPFRKISAMSVIEAVLAGCVPLLPDRLSYPETCRRHFTMYFYTGTNTILSKNWPGSS
ncbi:MAG: hypothetical protein R2860_12525 [Desulfobacterales bacterium]